MPDLPSNPPHSTAQLRTTPDRPEKCPSCLTIIRPTGECRCSD